MSAAEHAFTHAVAVRDALANARPALLDVILRRVHDVPTAEDILHNASARALERSHQLRDINHVDAWVARVVRNVLMDELRRRRLVFLPLDELELSSIEDDSIDCSCVLVQATQLKPDYSDILRRVVVEGAAVTDVARQLGITPNAAMVRLHRARTALRNRLREHCGTVAPRSCAECGCEQRGCCSSGAVS